jgi:hypothetical protein
LSELEAPSCFLINLKKKKEKTDIEEKRLSLETTQETFFAAVAVLYSFCQDKRKTLAAI